MVDPNPLPPMNSREMQKRSERLIEIFHDTAETEGLFAKAVEILDQVLGGNLNRDHIRQKAVTDSITTRLGK